MYHQAPAPYPPPSHPQHRIPRHQGGPTPPLPQRPVSHFAAPNIVSSVHGQPPRLPHRPPTWNAQAASASTAPAQYLPHVPSHAPMSLDQDFARLSVGPPLRAASPAMSMGPPTPVNPWAREQVGQYGNGHGQGQYQNPPPLHYPAHTSQYPKPGPPPTQIPPPYTGQHTAYAPIAPVPQRTSSFGAPSNIQRSHTQTLPSTSAAYHAAASPVRHGSMPVPSSSSQRLSVHSSAASSTSGASSSSIPPVVAPLPTVEKLIKTQSELDRWQDGEKLAWAEDVLRILDRLLNPGGSPTEIPATSNGSDVPTPQIDLPYELNELLGTAVPIIISTTSHPSTALASTALYLRAKLLSTGACSDLLPKDQRQAFRDFEAAAKSGEARAWFRLGRDYEGFGDLGRARECFEKGKNKGDCECTYRMGMAHLLGQLLLSPDPSAALPLLERAASLSSTDVPQPSYIHGMLLASELSTPVPIPPTLILPTSQNPSDALMAQWSTAREAIEHAAYLGLAPAQAKCGYFFEHAALGSVYDPLMSVQWYSLASQQGDSDADMSLSKWFLCGAEGHFGKNEELARTFAEKAARKGHPNGCFAMGYYYELGIGGKKDKEQAKKWYQRASKLDNADAKARLAALDSADPHTLSLSEHHDKVNETLVRRHTQAKIRSDRSSIRRPAGRGGARVGRADAAKVDAAARAAAAAPIMGGPVGMGQVFSPNPQAAGGWGSNGPMGQPQRYPSAGMAGTLAPSQAYHLPQSGSNGSINGLHNQAQGRPFRPQVNIPGPAGRRPSNGAISPGTVPVNGVVSGTGSGAVRSGRGYTLTDGPPMSMAAGGMRHSGSTTSLNDSGPGRVSPMPMPMPMPAQQEQGPGQGQGGGPGQAGKGPQTFAEMGFTSKPVEEDGCLIM